MLWHCWLGDRKGIQPVKTEWWGAGVVICLEQGADLHMAQWIPLPLTVSCFSKSRLVLPFWYRPTRVVPDTGPLNGCVCVHARRIVVYSVCFSMWMRVYISVCFILLLFFIPVCISIIWTYHYFISSIYHLLAGDDLVVFFPFMLVVCRPLVYRICC